MPALAETHSTLPHLPPRCEEAGAGALSTELKPSPRPRPKPAESIDRLAHDARNVLSSLMLYGELLAAPGVLAAEHTHFAQELEAIAAAVTRLLEKILETNTRPASSPVILSLEAGNKPDLPTPKALPLSPVPVTDAAADLRRLQPLLAAMAGPGIRLSVATMPCPGRTALAMEDFTRILINLVRNAAEALRSGGHVRITAQFCEGLSFLGHGAPAPRGVLLTVSDDGPGIPEPLREQVFDLGFTSRKAVAALPVRFHRGMGLSIVRNLVESAGGTVRATASHKGGACFEIVLPFDEPVTSGTCSSAPSRVFSADSGEKGCIECH